MPQRDRRVPRRRRRQPSKVAPHRAFARCAPDQRGRYFRAVSRSTLANNAKRRSCAFSRRRRTLAPARTEASATQRLQPAVVGRLRAVAGATRESGAALRLPSPTRPRDKRLGFQALRINYGCSPDHRSSFTVTVTSVAPADVIDSVACMTPSSGVSATGWITHAASSSVHRTANHFMGDPMSAQLTHFRARHHVADLEREADAATGAGATRARLPRSTRVRVTVDVNEGIG
jgi:hypothetical protein